LKIEELKGHYIFGWQRRPNVGGKDAFVIHPKRSDGGI